MKELTDNVLTSQQTIHIGQENKLGQKNLNLDSVNGSHRFLSNNWNTPQSRYILF